MSYYFSKILEMPFAQATQHVTDALASKGFGVLATIDVRATMKKRLDIDFRSYTILGACNPEFAYKALQAEDTIGTMLPCNVRRPGSWQARGGGLGRRSCSLDDGYP